MYEELKNCPVCHHSGFDQHLMVKDHFLTGEEFKLVKCPGCGFIFVNPRPDFAAIGNYYKSEEYISHDASKTDLISRIYKVARNYSIRGKYNLVKTYAKSGSILDYGCGTGEFLAYCRLNGFHTTGVEPNQKARTFAIEKNGIIVSEKLDDLISENKTFKIITLWHVLEHVHELNETIENLIKLLGPAGTLVIAVPNCTSQDAAHYGSFWAAYDVPRHIYHFTESTIRELFKKHRFSINKIFPQKLDAYYVSMLSEKYMNGKNNYLRWVLNGFLSNFNAGNAKTGYSSQIYILQRENP